MDERNSLLRCFGLVRLFHLIQLPLIAVTIAAGLTILVNGICDVNFFRNFNPR